MINRIIRLRRPVLRLFSRRKDILSRRRQLRNEGKKESKSSENAPQDKNNINFSNAFLKNFVFYFCLSYLLLLILLPPRSMSKEQYSFSQDCLQNQDFVKKCLENRSYVEKCLDEKEYFNN